MARNVKPGITFYRMDSGHILNKKVRLLFNEFDSDGYYIWSCVRDYAYLHRGWYFDMNDQEELELFAADYCKKKLDLVMQVIQACCKRGLFDAQLARDHKILSSPMMQEVFLYATDDRRKKTSQFIMPAEWLLIDFEGNIPRNIIITPGKNAILPGRNAQTRQDKNIDNTISLPARAGSPDSNSSKMDESSSEGKRTRRKIFQAPTIVEIKSMFLQQYNPKNPNTWFPDRCNREALDFFDYYVGKGWTIGKSGRQMVDWVATARRWIRKARSGQYDNSFNKDQQPGQQQQPSAPAQLRSNIPPANKEINYLFDAFLEDPAKVSYYVIEANHYDHLKSKGLFSFTDDKISEIKQLAVDAITEKKIELTENILTAYMKKIAVIEFFKQCSAEGRPAIFEI